MSRHKSNYAMNPVMFHPIVQSDKTKTFNQVFQQKLCERLRQYNTFVDIKKILPNNKTYNQQMHAANSSFIPNPTLGISAGMPGVVAVNAGATMNMAQACKDRRTCRLDYYQQWREMKVNIISNRLKNSNIVDEQSLQNLVRQLANEVTSLFASTINNFEDRKLNEASTTLAKDSVNKMLAYVGSLSCRAPSNQQQLLNAFKIGLLTSVKSITPKNPQRSYEQNPYLNQVSKNISTDYDSNGNINFVSNLFSSQISQFRIQP